MKTFTDEEINALAKSGKISQKDYMKLLLTAKQAVETAVVAPDNAEITALIGIRDTLAALAAKIEPFPLPLPTPPPQVTVTLPKRGNWTATVTKRDAHGFIETVSFKEATA